MKRSRFFVDQPLSCGEHQLSEALAHYMGRVLRLSAGALLQLFDGSGQEFLGELLEVGKKSARVRIDQVQAGQAESRLQVHLGQGLSRGERMDWAIQKACELGVAEITPLFTERCEVKLNDERQDKRLVHWRQVLISACEQCGRSQLPRLHAPMLLADWIKQVQADLKLVLHPVAQPLTEHQPPQRLAFLIGPEGGLSEAEVSLAQQADFQAARLGPRVLRTETAPVVALAVAQQLWGDF